MLQPSLKAEVLLLEIAQKDGLSPCLRSVNWLYKVPTLALPGSNSKPLEGSTESLIDTA